MTLRKRIFRLTFFMLSLSLLIMGGVSVFVLHYVFVRTDTNYVNSKTVFDLQKSMNSLEVAEFDDLAQTVQSKGGQFYVLQDNQLVYSTGGEEAEDVSEFPISNQAEAWEDEDELIISRRVEVLGVAYQVYAVFEDWEEGSELVQLQAFVGHFILLLVAAFLVFIGLNSWFTRRILRAISRPLYELQSGVHRIETGDYQTPIVYRGDREFEDVIAGFNSMQSSLQASQKQNRLYEQNRTQMVAAISHDLRTPLTSIKGYSKGLLDGVAQTAEKKEQYLGILYQKSLVMEALLEKLFVFSQLETDQLPFHLETLDLSRFLTTYIEEKRLEFADKEVQFETSFTEPIEAVVDRLQFRRLLDNLVDNAVKYAGVVPLILSLSLTQSTCHFSFTFTDNGQGLPPEELEVIFKEFYRVDPARHQEGHGLGLSIVHNIVQRLGGTISVENREGLRFTIVLPKEKEPCGF